MSSGTPPTRYSSTSPTPAGTSTAIRRAALARLDRRRARRRTRARARPCRVALVEQPRGRHVAARARRSAASSSNTFRSGALARLSVPTATRTPERRTPTTGGTPAPVWRVAARTGDQRGADGRQPLEIGAVICTPCTDEHAGVEEARPRPRYSTGLDARRDPAPDPTCRPPPAARRQGPPPGADELDLLGRLGQVHAARDERPLVDGAPDRAEHAAAPPNTARAPPGWRARGASRRARRSPRRRRARPPPDPPAGSRSARERRRPRRPLSASRSKPASVLLMSPMAAVPARRASAIASVIAFSTGGARGSVRRAAPGSHRAPTARTSRADRWRHAGRTVRDGYGR